MNVAKKILGCSLTALLWASLAPGPQPCLAQSEEEPILLKAVKVTAQKREENVQDVPMAVDVVNEETIRDAGIGDMEDLQFFVPNMYQSGGFQEHSFVIRGVRKFTSAT